MARHETRPFLELTRNISHSFQAEEIEVRVTKKLCQEFSRTESRILGALSNLNEFRLNAQVRTHSGTVPKTLRNTNVENQKSNEDRSQEDPHPEVGPPSVDPVFRTTQTQTRLHTVFAAPNSAFVGFLFFQSYSMKKIDSPYLWKASLGQVIQLTWHPSSQKDTAKKDAWKNWEQ